MSLLCTKLLSYSFVVFWRFLIIWVNTNVQVTQTLTNSMWKWTKNVKLFLWKNTTQVSAKPRIEQQVWCQYNGRTWSVGWGETLTFDGTDTNAIPSELFICAYNTTVSIWWTELWLLAWNKITVFSNGDLDIWQNETKINHKRALHTFKITI